MVTSVSILVMSVALSVFYLWATCLRIIRCELRKRQ
jgi:hypothetical protein